VNRTQTILSAVLAVQIAAIGVSTVVRRNEARTATAHPLLTSLTSLKPAKIVIDGPDGKSVTLDRKGAAWRVASAGQYPADASKIDDLLGKLRRIEVTSPIAEGKRVLEPLGVSETNLHARVRIFDSAAAATKPNGDVVIGTSSNGLTHIRKADSYAVYETRAIEAYDVGTNASSWIDTHLVDIPTESINALRIENASGTIDLQKKDNTWTLLSPANLASKTLDTDKVDALVRAAAVVTITDPAGPLDPTAQGFDKPTAIITIDQAKPPATTIRIGAPVPTHDDQLYITRDGLGFAATVRKSSVQSLIDAKGETLVK
jgi:Domain of unknown function (DUF4340)